MLDPLENFAAQFEPDRDDFLYRLGERDAPIRVTSEERQRFIREYQRRHRLMTWSAVALSLVGIVIFLSMESDVNENNTSWALILTIPGILLIVAGHFWAYYAPSRELRFRSVEGTKRTREDVTSRTIERTSWIAFLVVAGVAVGLLRAALDAEPGTLAYWFYWLCSAGLAISWSILAYRKWRGRKPNK